jgi:hypothetical protein
MDIRALQVFNQSIKPTCGTTALLVAAASGGDSVVTAAVAGKPTSALVALRSVILIVLATVIAALLVGPASGPHAVSAAPEPRSEQKKKVRERRTGIKRQLNLFEML